ncbi:MAG: tripartite tricarboxylate transporter TctB family protein [Thermodesulfobacteriota bacterium]
MRHDVKIGTFLFLISILLVFASLRLGIGKANDPGPGFFPFLAGLMIAFLSLTIILSSFKKLKENHRDEGALISGKAALISLFLLLFGLFVEKAGFFVCTFLATLLMLRTNGMKQWYFLLLVGISTCLGIFLIFNLLLEVRLPLGILTFVAR